MLPPGPRPRQTDAERQAACDAAASEVEAILAGKPPGVAAAAGRNPHQAQVYVGFQAPPSFDLFGKIRGPSERRAAFLWAVGGHWFLIGPAGVRHAVVGRGGKQWSSKLRACAPCFCPEGSLLPGAPPMRVPCTALEARPCLPPCCPQAAISCATLRRRRA
jgi:hypothetical protein